MPNVKSHAAIQGSSTSQERDEQRRNGAVTEHKMFLILPVRPMSPSRCCGAEMASPPGCPAGEDVRPRTAAREQAGRLCGAGDSTSLAHSARNHAVAALHPVIEKLVRGHGRPGCHRAALPGRPPWSRAGPVETCSRTARRTSAAGTAGAGCRGPFHAAAGKTVDLDQSKPGSPRHRDCHAGARRPAISRVADVGRVFPKNAQLGEHGAATAAGIRRSHRARRGARFASGSRSTVLPAAGWNGPSTAGTCRSCAPGAAAQGTGCMISIRACPRPRRPSRQSCSMHPGRRAAYSFYDRVNAATA